MTKYIIEFQDLIQTVHIAILLQQESDGSHYHFYAYFRPSKQSTEGKTLAVLSIPFMPASPFRLIKLVYDLVSLTNTSESFIELIGLHIAPESERSLFSKAGISSRLLTVLIYCLQCVKLVDIIDIHPLSIMCVRTRVFEMMAHIILKFSKL